MQTTMDDRLGRHDDILKAHRDRFEAHKKWLQGQRSTPSFTPAGFDDTALDFKGSSPGRTHRESPLTAHSNGTINRSGPVYDDLIEKGKIYQQNKEKMREDAVKKEISTLQEKPKVSDMAMQMKRDDKIEERFRKLEAERRQVYEWNMAKVLKKEEDDQSYSFKPKISKKGRRATSRTGNTENNAVWQQKKEEQLDNLRTKKIIAEMAEVRGMPEIDERSLRLADKRKDKEGLQGYSHLDIMLERDRLSRLAAWERQQNEMRNSQPGNPRITAYAATMPREGEVFDRLYSTSYEHDAKRANLLQNRLEQEGLEFSYSPRITSTANGIARDGPVEDDLLERHAQNKAMQEEHVRMQIERERSLHTPAINPVSDEIAARLPETSRERLYKPKNRYYDPTEYPFQPNLSQTESLDKTSNSRGTGNGSGTDSVRRHRERIDQLYQREVQRQERLDQLRAEEDQKKMSECTFQPMTHADISMEDRQPLRVYNRVTQWARRRDQKLHEQRAEKHRSELQDCSFRPQAAGNTPKDFDNNTIYGGDGRAWGYEEFIDRQREARRRQEEKEVKAWKTGDNWKNEITVPQEFNLGRRDKPVKALQKPLEAPIQQPKIAPLGGSGYEAYLENYSPSATSLQGAAGLPPPGAFSERVTTRIVDR